MPLQLSKGTLWQTVCPFKYHLIGNESIILKIPLEIQQLWEFENLKWDIITLLTA